MSLVRINFMSFITKLEGWISVGRVMLELMHGTFWNVFRPFSSKSDFVKSYLGKVATVDSDSLTLPAMSPSTAWFQSVRNR
jgi:hypothetical protein